MHDSRACGYIGRVLRSIIPCFSDEQIRHRGPTSTYLPSTISISAETRAEIREFISTEVFKACITSLHDPYFVDIQSELALLIAMIVRSYAHLTATPRQILLSLPDMTAEGVDAALQRMVAADNGTRLQKAVVLRLLEGLRGVSIAEQGRVLPRARDGKRAALAERDTVQAKYAQQHVPAAAGDRERDGSPELAGYFEMFGAITDL